MEKPFLCLNMIVKNEAHIIEQTLRNLVEKIPCLDYYVVSDTGSDDHTVAILQRFFKEKNIQGEIYHDEWVDFGTNRTKALQHAFDKSTYLLIFDADDEIQGDVDLVPDSLTADAYYFVFGDPSSCQYQRILLIRNSIMGFSFKGVLHEYLECPPHASISLWNPSKYFICSNRTGARNLDPLKYQKDASVLSKAYYCETDEALRSRYAFYTAQSLYDCKDFEQCVQWYMKVLEGINWNQEKYIACYNMIHSLKKLQRSKEIVHYAYLSLEFDKERLECLYEAMKWYAEMGYFLSAFQIIQTPFLECCVHSSNKLFLYRDIYTYKLPLWVFWISAMLRFRGLCRKETEITARKAWSILCEYDTDALSSDEKKCLAQSRAVFGLSSKTWE